MDISIYKILSCGFPLYISDWEFKIHQLTNTLLLLSLVLLKIIVIVIINGDGTEWSPIQPVIIWVINKSRRLWSGSQIC